MNVLSIQSAVVYGHVGNRAAVFALQRLGHEAWPIDTVRFSNHPGHGGKRGFIAPAAEIAELVQGLDERGWLGQASAVLSGYMGAADQGPVIEDAVARMRRARPEALWALDPVIGDRGRVFVAAGIPEFLRERACLQADIIKPNAFELSHLTGRTVARREDALAAARALHALGGRRARRVVVATGLALEELPGRLAVMAVSAEGAWMVDVPRLDTPGFGAGDTFAALFIGHILAGSDAPRALSLATASLQGILARTAETGAMELALVEAQDEIVRPSMALQPTRLD